MAILWDAPVAPVDLTTFIREVPPSPQNTLSALFPTEFKPLDEVDVEEIIRTNRTAKFRAWDGRISVSDRDSGSRKRIKLPPLSDSISQGEYESLQILFARTNGSNLSALIDSIYNDAQNLTNNIHNRIELAWGDLLSDGKLTINENGLVTEADYGLAALGNIVTAGTPWTTVATADVLADLMTWCDAYRALNGFFPDKILTSYSTLRTLQTNTKLINAIRGAQTGVTRVNLSDINDLFLNNNLPTFLPAYDRLLSVDGVSTRPLAANKVVLLPPDLGGMAKMVYGVTATALELVNSSEVDFSFSSAPGIVGVVEKEGPPYRKFTYVDACGMPVIYQPRQLMVATVA